MIGLSCSRHSGDQCCVVLCIGSNNIQGGAARAHLNSLFLGHMPIAVPRSFLAAERLFCLISKWAAYIQICGIGKAHLMILSSEWTPYAGIWAKGKYAQQETRTFASLAPLLYALSPHTHLPWEGWTHLGKGEDAVGDEAKTGLINLARPISILSLQLLPQRVSDPQVDVPLPVALLGRRRHICYRSLVHLPHLRSSNGLCAGACSACGRPLRACFALQLQRGANGHAA